jgi:hypothetical protein
VPPARPAFGYTGDTRLATADDIGAISSRNGGGVQIRVGDTLAPAGLYASDHDCFVFLVDETRGVDDGTGHNALGRGFFMWNSEVGAASFGVTTFLYDAICGNHIVWGAKDVREVRLRHVGKSLDGRAFQELRATLIDYTNDDASTTEAKIREARTMVIGASKEDVIKAIFGKISGVSQRLLGESYDAAELSPRYGAPNTLWGMVNGMTEVSQRSGHTDDRTRIDRAAGELLGIAF